MDPWWVSWVREVGDAAPEPLPFSARDPVVTDAVREVERLVEAARASGSPDKRGVMGRGDGLRANRCPDQGLRAPSHFQDGASP